MAISGFGLGLRTDHYTDILEPADDASRATARRIDWFEIISENYMVPGGRPLHMLDRIAERYPLVMHGVSLSIGSTDPIDFDYLRELKKLADRIRPGWISDHLCWTGIHRQNMHDLLPLPFTEESLRHVVARIKTVQDFIEQPLVIENVSSYVTFKQSTFSEWDFLRSIVQETGCGLLLDVNNIYVSGFNHGFDTADFLKGIPLGCVKQIHLAGHENNGDHIIDTHDHPVIDPVWKLYDEALRRFGPIPTMIERDANIPPLPELVAELDHARKIADRALRDFAA